MAMTRKQRTRLNSHFMIFNGKELLWTIGIGNGSNLRKSKRISAIPTNSVTIIIFTALRRKKSAASPNASSWAIP